MQHATCSVEQLTAHHHRLHILAHGAEVLGQRPVGAHIRVFEPGRRDVASIDNTLHHSPRLGRYCDVRPVGLRPDYNIGGFGHAVAAPQQPLTASGHHRKDIAVGEHRARACRQLSDYCHHRVA